MQRGSLAMVSRKEGPAVWQFRWSEKGLWGARVQRKRVIGTIERYPNETAARSAVAVLLAEINSEKSRIRTRSITVAQICDHFEQRELAKDNTWRSHATKKTYQSHAGAAPSFNPAINIGCLYPNDHAGQTCSPGCGVVVGLCRRSERSIRDSSGLSVRIENEKCTHVEKGHEKGHKNVPFWVLDGLCENGTTLLE